MRTDSGGLADPELVDAASREVDVRERKSPLLVANGRITADEATIDYQAWVLVRDFLASGHLQAIEEGGADGRTVVDWALCEAAVDRALNKLTADAEAAEAGTDTDKAARLWRRRADVNAIFRIVSLRRQSIETLNRQLRQRERQAA